LTPEVAALKKLIPTARTPAIIWRRKSDVPTRRSDADAKRCVDIF